MWAAAMNGWVVRQVIRAAGEILLTAGVVGLLFLGYLVWGTGLRAESAQRALSGELNQEWRQGQARGDAVGASLERFDVATGQPFAFIRIPAFGRQWRYTLIQGTALAQLNVGGADRHRRARPGARPSATAARQAADLADHLRPGLDRYPPGDRHRCPGRRQAPLDDPSMKHHVRLDLAPAAWPHPRAGRGCWPCSSWP